MQPILKIERLSHKYSRSWAIRDINLEIGKNGITGLLGANGAGKSTTMNIVCGALNQTEGQVLINGIDLRRDPVAAKKEIGFLPQNPPLYTDLTCDEYLRYCAELRLIGKERIKQAMDEAKERCGITHVSGRLIRNLSGGYRQRIGIAQAIIHGPRLVVMDEPTNGLDPNQLIEVRKLIREIAQQHAVLLSSHILSEVHLLCKDIVMIEAGRIVFSDTMDAFDNYMQPRSILLKLGNPPGVPEILQVRGVTQAEFLAPGKARVYFEGGQEVSERLVEASLEHGWRLQEISFEKGLLDDTFKQLSTQLH